MSEYTTRDAAGRPSRSVAANVAVWRHRGANAPRSPAHLLLRLTESHDGENFEDEIRGQDRRDVAVVERRRDFHDIGTHDIEPRQSTDKLQDLVTGEAPHFGCTRPGSECRIDGVDVERDVCRPSAHL